jgi:fucose 4-O-acetylase-like acetyltransferase
VKNHQTSEGVSIFVVIVAQWIMTLFFVMSAIATYQVLTKASASRFKRLAIPFLFFGTFIFLTPI